MVPCNLKHILGQDINDGSSDLVTRQSGQGIRNRIEKYLEQEQEGAVVALDFSNIGIIDYSCADEIVAKLVSRLLGGEYGEKYLVLTGLNENQRENIEVALERKELAVPALMEDGRQILIGSLNNYLRETLDFIMEKGKITAKDLSDALKLGMNTSGTRLLNLHKKKLVKRIVETRNGERMLVYEQV